MIRKNMIGIEIQSYEFLTHWKRYNVNLTVNKWLELETDVFQIE
jgi:hypothetical protein